MARSAAPGKKTTTKAKSATKKAAPAKRQRRSVKGAQTKTRIMDVVESLIEERGTENFILEDICKATDLTVGAFYFHFSGRDDAIEQVLVRGLSDFYNDEVFERCDDEDVFMVLGKFYIETLQLGLERPGFTRALYVHLPRSVMLYELWLEQRQRLVTWLSGYISAAKQAEGLERGTPELDVHFFLAAVEGFNENLLFGADEELRKLAKSPANTVVNTALLWYRAAVSVEPPEDSVTRLRNYARRHVRTKFY